MAGKILHKDALVLCPHTPGSAQPDQTASRVTVSGKEVATVLPFYSVNGCGLNGSSSPPCTKAQWLKGAEHVFVGGVAVVISSGTSKCTPSLASLNPSVFQQRVTAS